MESIELRGVAVALDGRTVLRRASLAVAAGEGVALLGPSGSGKTTLLRTAAGLVPPTAGRVLVGGHDVTDEPPERRGLAMVHQGAPLVGVHDVATNVAFPLRIAGTDRAGTRSAVERLAAWFGFRRLLGRRADTLSTGERHLAATARAVARPPRALLLDEPGPHLDHHTRTALLERILEFRREHGTTLLVATNDVEVARVLADRVAVLDGGTVVQVGTLAALRDAPATHTVADLTTPVPLRWVPAHLVPGGGGAPTRLETAAGAVRSWDPALRDRTGPVVLGLGERDLALAAVDGDGWPGTVERVATTGPRRLVTVTTAAGGLTVSTDGDRPQPVPGDVVAVEVRRAVVAAPSGEVLAVLRRP